MNPRDITPPSEGEFRDFCLGKADPTRAREIEAYLEAASDVSPAPETPREDHLVGHLRGAGDLAAGNVAPARFPGYEVLREVGRGGMGRVLAARDLALGREVAIKVLLPGSAADRFVRESRITARLPHPGIPPVHALGTLADGSPFLVMKFVAGRTLEEAIMAFHAAPSPLAFRDLLRHFAAVCQAVAFAHSQGVVHRDIKPANVLLGGFGETLVADWGLAKELASRRREPPEQDDTPAAHAAGSPEGLTQEGAIVGTPSFMSPEQASGDPASIGTAADVYALGAVLYQILTGRPPYRGATTADTLVLVLEGTLVPPHAVRPETPRALDAVCRRALAKDPAARYASAGELAREVERWLADEPVAAYREPLGDRARRWVKGHRTLTAAAAVLLVLAVPLAVALAFVSDSARRRAEADRKHIETEQAATETARQDAARKARRREKVSAFYEKYVLSAPRPLGKDSAHDIGMKKALDKALPHLAEAFADEPEDEMAVSATLGHTYLALGEFDKAVNLLRRAKELAERLHGGKSRTTLEIVSTLGDALVLQGKTKEGHVLLAPAAEVASEGFGAEDMLTLTLRHNLAYSLMEQARYAEAEKELRELIPLRRRVCGPDNFDTHVSEHNLAQVLSEQGNAAKAEGLFRDLLRRMRRVHTDDHPMTLTCWHNLAYSLMNQRKYSQAEKELRELIPLRRRVCGPDHFDTHVSEHNLAQVLSEQGNAAKAEGLFRDLLQRARRARGEDDRVALNCQHNLAYSLMNQNKFEAAVVVLRELAPRRRRVCGPDHFDTHVSEHNLAFSLARLGKTAEAEDRFRDLLLLLEQRGAAAPRPLITSARLQLGNLYLLGGKYADAVAPLKALLEEQSKQAKPGDPDLTSTQVMLGWALLETGKPAEAEPLLRAALKARKGVFFPVKWQVANTESLLGAALLAQKKYDEAEPLLLSGYEGLLGAAKGYPPERLTQAHARVVRLYTDWGKADKAAEWQKKKPAEPK